ncbi:MAG: DUF4438 domain-containing protein, partial [Anaerolineales bacterium]|nr:DUF4438 domain-containing protein [Anaerolineales bacterium]
NVRAGDSAFGWVADHVEPGATTRNSNEKENLAVQNMVCIGNEATVVSGDAKGDKGVVVGKHGGTDNTMIDFPPVTLEKLVYGDKILIRIYCKDIVFEDYPNVRTVCISPRLVKAMNLRGKGGKLVSPVVAPIPAEFMGSGINHSSERGDYDMMTSDARALAEHGLDMLRLGDFVAIMNHDNRYGRCFRTGAVSIGVVVHGNSRLSSHGPGVVVLFTSTGSDIQPVIEPDANLAICLGFREDWKK